MQNIKRFFREFDLFSSLPTLRAKTNPETKNTCGGVLSLVTLILFAYLFIDQLTRVTNWEKINFVQSETNELQSNNSISSFMVGIGVEGFNLTQSSRFIRYEFREITMNGTSFVSARNLQKQNCQIDHWAALGDQAEKSYLSFNVKNKVCLKMGQNLSIQQSSTGLYKILSVTVNSCRMLDQSNQSVYTGCASEQQFAIGNSVWIKAYKYFTANVVFINTAFKPNAKQATTKYMDVIRTTFTINRGTQCIAYLSPYRITTDVSIMPFSETESEQGYRLDTFVSENFQSVIYFQNINVFWLLSAKSISIDRSIGKIDEVLSYAGGLFGIIISILAFFMVSFNQYRYELMVAEGAFNYSHDGSKVKQHDFNFFQYVKYCTYEWIRTLTCIELNWKNCKEVEETREEANHQLDVGLLFKKIQHFERVIEYLISEKENIGLYLTEPPSIEEVRRTRRITEYYEKIIKGQSAATVEDVQNIENVFAYAMDRANSQSRTDLVLGNSVTKRKLSEQPDKSRQNILNRVLFQFKFDEDIDDVDLDEEDLKVEQQIAQAFFQMSEVARRKIQQKIPLKILHRLKRKYEASILSQTMAINLEI